jgi:prophage antirepressor-like protein
MNNQMEKENIITKFNYNNTNEVRTIMIDDNPWFVAKDICNILEIKSGKDAVSRLDEDERERFKIATGDYNAKHSSF